MKKQLIAIGIVLFVLIIAGCQSTAPVPADDEAGNTQLNEASEVQPRLIYGDIKVSDVERAIEENPEMILLDVRTEAEHAEDALPDSIVIPVQELNDRILELDQDETYLVYCRSGNRSSQAMKILEDAGFTKLFHMKDGMNGYRQVYPKNNEQ